MANLSSIYDGLITLIQTQLPAYIRMADAYDVTNNDILSIIKGYSLAIKSGVNTQRNITCAELSSERTFELTLTNLYTANDNDPTGRATIEKSIMEDAFKVWKSLQAIHSLGGVQISGALYSDDTGLEYLDTEDGKAITVVSSILVEYFE